MKKLRRGCSSTRIGVVLQACRAHSTNAAGTVASTGGTQALRWFAEIQNDLPGVSRFGELDRLLELFEREMVGDDR
jgi:hypothetical protein